MVSINDIAKEAGVAKSTVSRYLNNGSVSLKTKAKIDEIVKKRGYKPNTFARSLKAQKTNMIGVIIPRLNSPSTNEVLSGIDAKAHELGYQLIITNANQDEKREIEDIYALAKQKVDGIIFLAKSITAEHREAIKNIELPCLVLGQYSKDIPSIVHDDHGAGRKIAKHALTLRHKYFLYFTVSSEDKAVGQDRYNGFIEEIDKEEGTRVRSVETSFIMQEAYQTAINELKNLKATFIVGATDTIALAVMKAASELGLSVPEDISMAGHGGYDLLSFVTPALTSIKYPYYAIGEMAVDTLENMILKKEVAQYQVVPNELVVRETTQNI
ncbi:LacI family DNA-binding transcriptional regulator [Alkalibacterium kapii]|uniref:LacI family transcriptional regulator n=1 Tax=Alkalibacterium kapii TaxID=426704 RepID=A0A511AQP7_9LACT|nr:LacI family DNA-binding transcriptional regulator [Alkalibacterium kapii]GEK90525.1 LacI family transcriptional regulator [Alkalibacterium kapii]